MPKVMEDHLKEFMWKILAVVSAGIVTTVLTSLFMSTVVMPQKVEALEKQVNQNTCDIKQLQEDTNVKITKIYEILVTTKK